MNASQLGNRNYRLVVYYSLLQEQACIILCGMVMQDTTTIVLLDLTK